MSKNYFLINSDAPFEIPNEVYPTKYIQDKVETRRGGGGGYQKPPKLNLKTYAGTERKEYMEDKMRDTLPTRRMAKLSLDKKEDFQKYNQKVNFPFYIFS